jgi:hypothetical protein
MKGDKIYYREGYKYQLCKDYFIKLDVYPIEPINTPWLSLHTNGLLTIRSGYAWDGPSGPTVDTKDSMRGSLVHDALYQLMRLGLIDISYRDMADTILRTICVEDGMNLFRAEMWRVAVKLFAEGCAKSGTERALQEAP